MNEFSSPPVIEETHETDDGPIVIFTLNNPDERNPLTPSLVGYILNRLEDLTNTKSPVAFVFTGSGSAFSAGGNLKGYQRLFRQASEFEEFITNIQTLCEYLETCRALSVAMVNGTCVAGGLELALSCDIITMADDAKIGDGHLKFAQLPGAGSAQRLVRAIGSQRAKYWLLSGALMSASQAVDLGLVHASYPGDQLKRGTIDTVLEMSSHSPLAFKEMKRLIRAASDETLDRGVSIEGRAALEYATQSHDAWEGLMAFAEKRSPNFKGE
jgi:enoyl-CoA hydratase/carnithine racemase